MENKERYLSILGSIKRDGIDELCKWIEDSDFFDAPASSRFHGAAPGMLCEHHLNVYDQAILLADMYEKAGIIKPIDRDSIALTALTHDLCKVKFYRQTVKNRKNDATGKWEQYMAYEIDERFCFGGHGSKSLFLVHHFVKLTPEEGVAINCHMSSWDGNTNVGKAFEQFPLAWIIHVADEAAAYLLESKN